MASLAAQGAKEIRLANRTLGKAQEIAAAVGPVVKVLPWDQRADALDGAALLANATSLGMAGKPPLEISLDRLPKGALVGDLTYILPETRMPGNITVNGLGLLVGALTDGLTLDVLAVTLTLLSLVAGTSFAGDDRTMEFIESYRGYRITVTTVRTSDAGWTASAKIVMSDDKTVTVRPDPTDNPGGKLFHSEEDAKAAALRAAVTAIDRGRVSIGKP